MKTVEQKTKDELNAGRIMAKKNAGEKLTFAERNILNIYNKRNKKAQ